MPTAWRSLEQGYQRNTGIKRWDLDLDEQISVASLAAPAEWMKRRYTSKIGDMACCLLGVFDVQMPLVYDERTNARSRLGEAVSKKYKR